MTKPKQMACAPSEDSDQPGHPPSDQNLCYLHKDGLALRKHAYSNILKILSPKK